jgi:predicted enzyme involved in methoxymalonyl-ACP biosynthesis
MKHLRRFNESVDDLETEIMDALLFLKDDEFSIEVTKEDVKYHIVRIKKDDNSTFNLNQIASDVSALISLATEDLNQEISYMYILKENEKGQNEREFIDLDTVQLKDLSVDIKVFRVEFKDKTI